MINIAFIVKRGTTKEYYDKFVAEIEKRGVEVVWMNDANTTFVTSHVYICVVDDDNKVTGRPFEKLFTCAVPWHEEEFYNYILEKEKVY